MVAGGQKQLKTLTHQTDNKEELAVTKIGCLIVFCPPLSSQNVALFTTPKQKLRTKRLVRAAPRQVPLHHVEIKQHFF